MVVSLIPFLTTIYHIYLSDRSITLVYFYLHITPEAHMQVQDHTLLCHSYTLYYLYIYVCVSYRPVLSIKSLPVPSTLYLSVPCIYSLQITPLTIYCYFWITRPFISTCTYIIDVFCRYTVYTCFLETVLQIYLYYTRLFFLNQTKTVYLQSD